jgi:hypothetical protein
MRISNPRRFNGDILASRKEILQWLGLGFANQSAQLGVSGQLSASIIPELSGLSYVTGQTLADKFAAFEGTISEGIQPKLDIFSQVLTGFTPGNTVSGEFEAVRELIADIKAEAINVDAGSGIIITSEGVDNVISVKVADTDKVLTADETGLFAEITLSGVTPDSASYASAYQLVGKNGQVLGETINIPKDQFLKGVEYIPSATALDFTFYLADGTEKLTRVEIGDLVDTYTAGAGITLAGNEFSLVKDSNADSKFLQIGTDTIGLSGITEAINTVSGIIDGDWRAALAAETSARIENDNFLSGAIDAVDDRVDVISGLLSGAQGAADTLILAGGEGKFVDSEYVISNDETIVSSSIISSALWTVEATTDYVSGQISATLQVVDDLAKNIKKFYVDETPVSGEALVFNTAENSTTLYVGGDEYVISTPLAADFDDVVSEADEAETAASVFAVKEYVSGYVSDYVTEAIANKPDTAVEGADGLVTKLTYTTDADYDLTVFRGAELSGAADTDVLTAGAVKTVVDAFNDSIDTINAGIEEINSKAIQLIEESVTLVKSGDVYTAPVTGRVLNIFDADEEEVFINKVYTKASGITTLSVGADEVETEGDITLTVIVAKTLAVREIIRLILLSVMNLRMKIIRHYFLMNFLRDLRFIDLILLKATELHIPETHPMIFAPI